MILYERFLSLVEEKNHPALRKVPADFADDAGILIAVSLS